MIKQDEQVSWYTDIDKSESLTQGDILFKCPIVVNILEGNQLETYDSEADVIILSQACDLEQNKVTNILTVEILDIDFVYKSMLDEKLENELKKLQEKGEEVTETSKNNIREKIDSGNSIVKFCDMVARNQYPRYHMLNEKISEGTDSVEMKFSIIDFSKIHMLNIDYLNLQREIIDKKIRVNSPFKEFISQRFGLFYSRIGLPNGIDDKVLKKYTKYIAAKNYIENNLEYVEEVDGEYVAKNSVPKKVTEAIQAMKEYYQK